MVHTFLQVGHLEPWERGSRKTSGQVGMCGGVSMTKSYINDFGMKALPPGFVCPLDFCFNPENPLKVLEFQSEKG